MESTESRKKSQGALSEERILAINKRSFFLVCGILCAILIGAYILTFILPKGELIDGVFVALENPRHLSFFGFLISPLETLWHGDTASTVIVVSLFILILGGVFNLIDKTNGIHSIIGYIIQKNEKHKRRLLYEMILIFMLFGSLFGIFEEAVTLLPVVVILTISLGWDTFTGLCICLVATGFGFSTALTNPFSVGLSVTTVNNTVGSDLSVTDGIWFRILIFILMYLILCGFVTLHVRKIEKDPMSSPTYESDLLKRESLHLDGEAPNKRTVLTYGIMFLSVVVITVVAALIPATSGLTVPIIAVAFLVGGITSALILGFRMRFIGKALGSGALSMLPAVVMVLLASSIRLVLEKGGIMPTIIHYMTEALSGKSPIVALLLIYAAILVIQFFIGSASAKVVVVVPMIAVLVEGLGLSQNLALLAFIFGDGYTDLLYPTNPILMISLGMVSFSYTKWLKKTLPLQLLVLLLTAGILLLGYVIGY